MRGLKALVALVALAALTFAATGTAQAKDRNNDNIPDRWEKRHDLSLKVKQGRRDQDSDGLKNRAEFRAKTDPRDADSDDDGTEDGDEGAGTIESYDAETGELVIALSAGGTLSGLVTDETRIRCGCKGTDDEYEPGDDEGEDAEDSSGPGGRDGGPHGDGRGHHGPGGHHGHRDDRRCSAEALVPGAAVSEAELDEAETVFEEVELVRSKPPKMDDEVESDDDESEDDEG